MNEESFDDLRLSLNWTKNHVEPEEKDKIVDYYNQWLSQPLYYILKKTTEYVGNDEFVAIRARKRGDYNYARTTTKRFQNVAKHCRTIGVRVGRKKTSALSVSFTYKSRSLSKWESIGTDFNLFITRLRKRYGRVNCVRIWESHKSGIPHIHAVLLFEQHVFKCFTFRDKIRIEDKSEIARLWDHGFIDVQGVYNLEGAIGYLLKYLRKTLSHEIEGATITLAMLWFHRKRMFSISRDLIGISVIQTTKKTCSWTFIGLCTSCVDLERVYIKWAEKTDKGCRIKWEKQKQLVLSEVTE